MRVLHVINGLTSGGAEKLVYELSCTMKEDDNHIEVLALSSLGDVYSEKIKRNKINVTFLTTGTVYSPFLLFAILQFFRKNDRTYDIVHVHLFPSLYFMSILCKLHLIDNKLIFHEHNTENRRNRYRFFKPIDRFIYSSYRKVICISEAVKIRLKEYIYIDENKLVVINNGINVKACKESCALSREEINVNLLKDDILLVMAARFTEQKDHETLVQALKLLPHNYKLLLLGEGERMNQIKLLVENLHISDRVLFLGFQSNVYSYIKACDIFILSSHWEGFGLSCVEAMACGIPVIASDVNGLKEVVKGAGLLFPSHDISSLKNQILKLTSDRMLYEEMQRKGLRRAEHYSIENMYNSLMEVYHEI